MATRLAANILGLVLLTATSYRVSAEEFELVGDMEGTFCTNYYVFKTCGWQKLHAVGTPNGGLAQIRQRYDAVSEFREGREGKPGRCWIRLRSDPASYGWWATIYNNLAGLPEFYQLKAGADPNEFESYEKLGTPDDVTFSCQKID